MRKEERKPVSRAARIELEGGRSLACRITDASDGGAMLTVPDSEWLPKTFVVHDNFSGTRRLVQVMWTSPNRVGVRYIDRNVAPPVARKTTGFGKRR